MLDDYKDSCRFEAALIAAWSELLARPVTAETNVFDAGANSIHLLLVLNRIRELGLEADATWFFEHPTVAGFAQACGEGMEGVGGDAEEFLL